jgi:hypothetical protein
MEIKPDYQQLTLRMKKIFYIGLLSISLLCCKQGDPYFEFLSLDAFKYETTSINEGTLIQILSFSGGPDCTPKTTYYYQYIGINKENNDTVRILSPCQVLPEGNNPTEGTYSSWIEQSGIIDKVLKEHGENNFESGKKVVVFNKAHREIEKGDYKTAIGTLGFK